MPVLMIQYMRPLEDSVRIAFYPDALSDASLEDSNRMPIYSDTPYSNAPRVARALYISAATPHAWKSWILFA